MMVPIYLRFQLQMQAGRFVHAAFHLDQCREIGERHAPRSLCIIQSYLLTMRALSPSVCMALNSFVVADSKTNLVRLIVIVTAFRKHY
jgi:hypothetical protein